MLSCLQLFTTQMFTENEPSSLFLFFYGTTVSSLSPSSALARVAL